MPVYHFNVWNGHPSRDERGVELADLRAARALAIRYMAEVMLEQNTLVEDHSVWRMEVTDDLGERLVALKVSVEG